MKMASKRPLNPSQILEELESDDEGPDFGAAEYVDENFEEELPDLDVDIPEEANDVDNEEPDANNDDNEEPEAPLRRTRPRLA